MPTNALILCALALAAVFCTPPSLAESAKAKRAPPAITSIFPLGTNPGSQYTATVRGVNLGSASAVWLDCQHLSAEIESIGEVEPPEVDEAPYPLDPETKKLERKLYELKLRVTVSAQAELGGHQMRLVTPKGVTGSLLLLIDSDPIVAEIDQPHSSMVGAQPIEFPSVVNARLAEPGEVDCYSFDVEAGQELQLEVRTTHFPHPTDLGDPQLVLLEPEGSWFDPNRGVRLEVTDLWRPPPGDQPQITYHRLPRVRRQFDEAGRYVVRVDTVGGQSGPDYSYQLKILEIGQPEGLPRERWGPLFSAHSGNRVEWTAHNFNDPLGPDRLQLLWARGVPSDPSPNPIPIMTAEEPNNSKAEAVKTPVPTILQGIIDKPGDVDWFRFHAEPGEKLAFEIETPYRPPPFFNPRIGLIDREGKELANNIYRELGGDGDDWIKLLAPKILYAFDSAGDYFIQVHDLTSRVSGEEFQYRLVVRPQMPHVGRVVAKNLDHVHLEPTETRTVAITVELEEGFEGGVALSVENLPPGVIASPVASTAPKSRRPADKRGGSLHRERHFPRRNSAAIMLMATDDIPAATLPHEVRILARPILKDRVGKVLPTQGFLLTRASEGAKLARMDTSR